MSIDGHPQLIHNWIVPTKYPKLRNALAMAGLAETSLAQTTDLADKMPEKANILAENEPILCSCFVPCKLNKELYIISILSFVVIKIFENIWYVERFTYKDIGKHRLQ